MSRVRTVNVRAVSDSSAGRQRPVAVTIAVLTYLRPADLRRCLEGLLPQVRRLGSGVDMCDVADILVVDNDPSGGAATVVAQIDAPEVRYVHEPTAGISAGRNRALVESAAADLLIFVDDDEEPQAGWLDLMVGCWREYGAAAVAGRVVSAFDGALDPWIAGGGFFRRRNLPTGTPIGVAATNNLLLDLTQVRGLGVRFDPRFGLSGGGDTHFTRSLVAAGGSMVWCNEAVVTDHVPTGRMTRRWVLSRARRNANVEVRVDVLLAPSATQALARRALGAARGVVRLVTGTARHIGGRLVRSAPHQAEGLRTAWRGVGMVAGAVGVAFGEYHRPESDEPLPLSVLMSFPVPRPTTNPYVVMLGRAIAEVPGARVRYFAWPFALAGRYQVFHVHWPEILVGGRPGLKKTVRQMLFLALLARLAITRTPVVRTLHNVRPHDSGSRCERALLHLLDRRVEVAIALNSVSAEAAGRPVTTILHGHYRDWFADRPEVDSEPGALVFAGLIRDYKNVPALVDAVRETTESDGITGLRVVGRPTSEALATALTARAAGDHRISLLLRFATDAELTAEIGRAELVVLPYREMFNSGAALMALSLGRPILVPETEVNRLLAAEVGPGWVLRYVGELRGHHLVDALVQLRSAASLRSAEAQPDLTERQWAATGRDHVAAYRSAVAHRGGRRSARSGRVESRASAESPVPTPENGTA